MIGTYYYVDVRPGLLDNNNRSCTELHVEILMEEDN